ncbi:hypothetical protein CRENBAI_006854 [Crenichthys baileyi]|uniref:Acyl-CoA thioester hydrolase/bile acid-CoA amino acid N-acetyltransferase domain-containing protein n=1 Tax=Crenichthys baileyi TaxID=28760 RepID=A0AAV9S193_9TELE
MQFWLDQGASEELAGLETPLGRDELLKEAITASHVSELSSSDLAICPTRVDETFEVLVENLPPGCLITIRSLHHSEDGDDWEAYGLCVSDHSRRVSGSAQLL